MEYTKDIYFKVNYNTSLEKTQTEQKKWTSSLLKKIKQNKLLITVLISLIVFASLNIVMIHSFMRIYLSIAGNNYGF